MYSQLPDYFQCYVLETTGVEIKILFASAAAVVVIGHYFHKSLI